MGAEPLLALGVLGGRTRPRRSYDDPFLAPSVLGRSKALRLLDARAIVADGAAPLSNVNYWLEALAALNIDLDVPVALLDDGRLTDAAHAWFVLQHFGVFARIVDGGWRALQDVDLAQPPSGIVKATGSLHAGSGAIRSVSAADWRDATSGGAVIVDSRLFEQWPRHEREAIEAAVEARNIPYTALTYDERIRPVTELQGLFTSAGVKPHDPIIVFGDDAGEAALTAAALLRAGYDDLGLYLDVSRDRERRIAKSPVRR